MKKLLTIISFVLITCLVLCIGVQYAIWRFDLFEEDEPVLGTDPPLTLHFIDVGQGDCTLIESQGHYALIDAGEYSERKKVMKYLTEEGVESLDFIISTHPHSDHCGGLSEVIRRYNPPFMLSPNADSDSPSWEYVLDAADERGVEYITPEPYDTYQIGAATLTILSPSSDAVYSNLNNYSIVSMVEYEDSSFLITGDAEYLVENELMRSGYDLSADVLRCGHHGSSSSTNERFVKAVDPDAAIISCGKDNDYGHPHMETITVLNKYQIPIWRTDEDSNIIAETDGKEIYIYSKDEEADVETDTVDINYKGYIGNKSSKIYHMPYCGSVSEMYQKNKVYFDTKEDAENSGYNPCGSCKPY